MTFSKPYLSGDKEYLEVYNVLTMEEGDLSGRTEYSEGQFPYSENVDEFPAWEFTWPEIAPFPVVPPIIDPTGDPSPHPCSSQFTCHGAGIIGADQIQCPGLTIYNQVHVVVGCHIPAAWAALGAWEITQTYDDGIVIASQSPVSCTIETPSQIPDGQIELTYYGPLNCIAHKVIDIRCGCCDGLTLWGKDTAYAFATYNVEMTPHCPNAVGTVEWVRPTGCPDDPLEDRFVTNISTTHDGWKVEIDFSADACGAFKITVTNPGEDCEEVATKNVLMALNGEYGGEWTWKDGVGAHMDPACDWFLPDYPEGAPPWPCSGEYRDGGGGEYTDPFYGVPALTVDHQRFGRGYLAECRAGMVEWCVACSDCAGVGEQTWGEECNCGRRAPAPAVWNRSPGNCGSDPWTGSHSMPPDCCWPSGPPLLSSEFYLWDLCEWDCPCPDPL